MYDKNIKKIVLKIYILFFKKFFIFKFFNLASKYDTIKNSSVDIYAVNIQTKQINK